MSSETPTVVASIQKHRLVPVAVIPDISHALPLAEALLAGGLPIIEVTLRTDCAMDAMREIRKNFPEMEVGAGTILSADVIPELMDIGVSFGVSPGLNPVVVETAQKAGFPIIPGVVTPSEVERALSMGLSLLKFFPAEAVGGAKLLKALAGPYGHTGVQFVPTGGINPELAMEYWKLPATLAVGGSWFVNPHWIAEGNAAKVTEETANALRMARTVAG